MPGDFCKRVFPSDFVTDSILIDYFEAGRILGEKAAEKNLPGEKVCLFAQEWLITAYRTPTKGSALF